MNSAKEGTMVSQSASNMSDFMKGIIDDTEDGVIRQLPTKVTKFDTLNKKRIEDGMDDNFLRKFGIVRIDDDKKIIYDLRDCKLSKSQKDNTILTQFYIDIQREMLSYSGLKPLVGELAASDIKNLYSRLIERKRYDIIK